MTITDRAEKLIREWYDQDNSWPAPQKLDRVQAELHQRIITLMEELIEQCAHIADTHERDAQHDFLRATDSADRMKISGRVEAAGQVATAIRDIP